MRKEREKKNKTNNNRTNSSPLKAWMFQLSPLPSVASSMLRNTELGLDISTDGRSNSATWETEKTMTVVEIAYIESTDCIDLDCSRKLSIVLNVSVVEIVCIELIDCIDLDCSRKLSIVLNVSVVEIVYIELTDCIDLDCSRKLSIVLNVSVVEIVFYIK